MSEKILDRKPTALEHLYCNNCIGKNTCDHNAAVRCPSHFDRFFTGYKLGEKHAKEKAIEAFTKFVKEYSHESGRHDISKNEDHYIKVFESIINSK